MMTGSVNRNVGCSGVWLAEHEYVIEDVNKWSFLARSGRLAGATSQATHGDLMRSARHRTVRGTDPLLASARARVRAVDGTWLLMYGSPLTGNDSRTAVIIQQASPSEVAPLIALAYGLTPREAEVTRMCIEGRATNEIAAALYQSPYKVQDHLKAIFDKTGVRSRGALVAQVFLEHYLPRWEPLSNPPEG